MSIPQRQEAYRPTRREPANAIRVLCMDAVEQAPRMAMREASRR